MFLHVNIMFLFSFNPKFFHPVTWSTISTILKKFHITTILDVSFLHNNYVENSFPSISTISDIYIYIIIYI